MCVCCTDTRQTQAEAAQLIAAEIRLAITSGFGVHLALHADAIDVTPYSATSALCRLTFTFKPPIDSEYAGKDWTFTNLYGYRAASAGEDAGWEYIVRDQEATEMLRVTGKTLE